MQLGFVEVAACVDEVPERAKALAAMHGARALTLDDVLTDPDIDAIVNLTPPLAHAAMTRRALDAGKATFSEKPLGVEFAEGTRLVEHARASTTRGSAARPTRSSGPGSRAHER